MIVHTWREAFTKAMRDSGDSWDNVVWKNTREDWLDSRQVPEWNELVMTEKYTYAVFYNNDAAAPSTCMIRAPRLPDIPFGLGVALFEVWWDCLTIDVNKEV